MLASRRFAHVSVWRLERLEMNTYALLVGLQSWQNLLDCALHEDATDESKAFPVAIQRRDSINNETITKKKVKPEG